MLIAQFEIWPSCNKLCADFEDSSAMIQGTIDYIFGVIWITMLSCSPNQKSKQHGGNELPWPRKSAISECSCNVLDQFYVHHNMVIASSYIVKYRCIYYTVTLRS